MPGFFSLPRKPLNPWLPSEACKLSERHVELAQELERLQATVTRALFRNLIVFLG